MKYLFFVFSNIFFVNINAQCIVDAGPDIYVCVDKIGITDSSVLQANIISSFPADSIYWSSNHWFVDTDDIIDSTNIIQPLIFSDGGVTGGGPTTFTVTIIDSIGNICIDSTKVNFSRFAIIPISYIEINELETIQLPNIVGGGIPPLTTTWFPNYNISDTIGSVSAWPMIDTTYSSTVIDSVGCVNTFGTDIFVKVLPFGTGIKNLTENILSIYPNPVKEILNISFETKIEDIMIILSNSLGQIVLSQEIRNNQIDISFLSKGVYHFELVSKNKLFSTGNLIKE